MKTVLFALFLLFSTLPAFAVQPDEMLKDPVLEARARDISRNVRCLVCQGEDIDESNAGLAADLRRLVRERLTKGDSDDEVLAYLSDRYGDYVLLRPPVVPETFMLWAMPGVVFLGGLFIVFRALRRKKGGA